jgi:hypothetical protein
MQRKMKKKTKKYADLPVFCQKDAKITTDYADYTDSVLTTKYTKYTKRYF